MDRWRELFQGGIALTIVIGAIGVTVLLIVQGRSVEQIPAWLTLLLGAIAGTYFGQSGVATGVSRATNGMLDAARKFAEVAAATPPDPPGKQT